MFSITRSFLLIVLPFPCQVLFSFSVFVILVYGLGKLSFILEALFYLCIWGRISEIEPKALHILGKCSTTEFCPRLLYFIIFSSLTSVHYTHTSNRNLIIAQKLLISSILHRILFKLFFTFINFFRDFILIFCIYIYILYIYLYLLYILISIFKQNIFAQIMLLKGFIFYKTNSSCVLCPCSIFPLEIFRVRTGILQMTLIFQA